MEALGWSGHKLSDRQAALDSVAEWLVCHYQHVDDLLQGQSKQASEEDACPTRTHAVHDVISQSAQIPLSEASQGDDRQLRSIWNLLAERVKVEKDEEVLARAGNCRTSHLFSCMARRMEIRNFRIENEQVQKNGLIISYLFPRRSYHLGSILVGVASHKCARRRAAGQLVCFDCGPYLHRTALRGQGPLSDSSGLGDNPAHTLSRIQAGAARHGHHIGRPAVGLCPKQCH
jgi:hypothetical protein